MCIEWCTRCLLWSIYRRKRKARRSLLWPEKLRMTLMLLMWAESLCLRCEYLSLYGSARDHRAYILSSWMLRWCVKTIHERTEEHWRELTDANQASLRFVPVCRGPTHRPSSLQLFIIEITVYVRFSVNWALFLFDTDTDLGFLLQPWHGQVRQDSGIQGSSQESYTRTQFTAFDLFLHLPQFILWVS